MATMLTSMEITTEHAKQREKKTNKQTGTLQTSNAISAQYTTVIQLYYSNCTSVKTKSYNKINLSLVAQVKH